MNYMADEVVGFVAKYGATLLSERLVPFFLLIVGFFPISVSLVIALSEKKNVGALNRFCPALWLIGSYIWGNYRLYSLPH